MATYMPPWTPEEKIYLLLNIIDHASVQPNFEVIKLPKGRDIKSCEDTFRSLRDNVNISTSGTASFTPTNPGSLKRARDEVDSPLITRPLTDEPSAKKKRGRPPKAGGPTEKKQAAIAWALQTGQEIPKKKRGRPPKEKPAFPPASMANAALLPATMKTTNPDDFLPTPRKKPNTIKPKPGLEVKDAAKSQQQGLQNIESMRNQPTLAAQPLPPPSTSTARIPETSANSAVQEPKDTSIPDAPPATLAAVPPATKQVSSSSPGTEASSSE